MRSLGTRCHIYKQLLRYTNRAIFPPIPVITTQHYTQIMYRSHLNDCTLQYTTATLAQYPASTQAAVNIAWHHQAMNVMHTWISQQKRQRLANIFGFCNEMDAINTKTCSSLRAGPTCIYDSAILYVMANIYAYTW